MSANSQTIPGSNHHIDSNSVLPKLQLSRNPKEFSSYYLIARPKYEEYKHLYSLITDVACQCDGTPIKDVHCTLQAFKGKTNTLTFSELVGQYCSTLSQFRFEFTGIMNAQNPLSRRIWLMINKTHQLEKIHRDVGLLAHRLSLVGYPTEDWQPHIKVLTLPLTATSIPKTELFDQLLGETIQITTLELTRRVGEEKWETITEFELRT
jgi:hypothetical protein